MRIARFVLLVLAVMLAAGPALPAAAQGVGFEDMPGIQQAVSRTWKADQNTTPADVPAQNPRDLRKPVANLMLAAVYRFDTEANAAAAYQLLQTDMNATGMNGQPLTLSPVTLPVSLDHAAAVAVDATGPTRYDFTLVIALDGLYVYTVIGVTSGGMPEASVAATVRAMAAGQAGTDAGTLDPAGGSSGGLWGKLPSGTAIDRLFRGIVTTEDAVPFPA